MQNSARLLILLSIVVLSGCKEENTSFEDKFKPNQHFFFQRAFPDSVPNWEAIDRSLKEARNFAQSPSAKSSNVPWSQMGPFNIGGRINCIAVHPDDDNIILTGTAGGGVYRTLDGGATWEALTEELTHLPIGDVVFDPVNPSTIYVGTGDVNISGQVYIGNGLYRSTDNGATWENIGLQDSRIISKIAINPNNPDQIFVASMGLPFVRNQDRGLYRSNDGGTTWEQVLFVSDESGIIDLAMNPDNPEIIYAANWNRIRTAFESVAFGEDAGIYKSIDGGDTWTLLGNGLPTGPMSRIGIQLWKGNPDVVFAIYVNTDYQLQGVYKSTDAGASFTEINTSMIPEGALGGFGWYFGKLAINPWDVNEISVLGVNLFTTMDNGNSWFMSAPEWWTYEVHADKHDMEYLDENTVLLATDGGLYKTVNSFVSWQDIDRIPNTQFYRIATNPFDFGFYYGGAQDNGTSGNSNLQGNADWPRLFGGDGFTPIPHPENPSWLYATTQNGNFWHLDFEFGEVTNLTDGINQDERTNWDSPIIIDHFDSDILYMATEKVYKMEGAPYGIWEPISASLVDPSDEFFSFRNISSLNQSKLNQDILYAGTSDGKVWVSQNGGTTWSDVSTGLPGYYVTDIKPDPFAENGVFVSVSGYRDNDETPHLYYSDNSGLNWSDITGDLPEMPVNHIEIYDELTWFIATDNGVYFTVNGGVNWSRAGNNMPFVVVLDLAIEPLANKLVAGTYGVSMFAISIEALINEVSGLSETAPKAVSVFPNPTSDFISVDIDADPLAEWRIMDIKGNAVLSGKAGNGNLKHIAVGDLAPGLYIFLLTEAESSVVSRFVVGR